MIKIIRINVILLILTFSISSQVQAGFKVPNYVYTASQLNSAQNKAIKNNQPITFIYSDKNTDCGLATAASKDIFQGLKNYSVIVYAERGKDWNKLPAIVKNGMNSPESGKYIPKTVIVNSSLNKIISIIPYAKKNKRKQLIKRAVHP
ncbi:MAG: hypothetical protein KAR13_22570 [Desulfobulbaceae bacterium]|nr:hypothetical protein [Desulfobulbaceae bacterium]